MDYVSPTQGQVVATLVLLFTANNAMVHPFHPVFGVFAGLVFAVAAGVLLLQAYGAYLVWSGEREQASLGN
ncbi:hypothetical protein [Halomarina oriensis]|uniref:Uncharacterized protein n=1 Tax=Halomarina oriensis TaxID=671145 RepID=A0A6B0GJZ1_9EURY|nr:hypothetical protein [Halomarina oriensis]MWG35236.1 hypothetical protein [Halomarina oriensis]